MADKSPKKQAPVVKLSTKEKKAKKNAKVAAKAGPKPGLAAPPKAKSKG